MAHSFHAISGHACLFFHSLLLLLAAANLDLRIALGLPPVPVYYAVLVFSCLWCCLRSDIEWEERWRREEPVRACKWGAATRDGGRMEEHQRGMRERERERERGKREREDAGCVMCIDAVQIFSGSRVEHALQEFAASNNSNRVIDTTATTPRRRPSGQALEEDSRWRKKTQFKQLEKQGGKKISNSKNRSNPHRR